ncbi:hypothetical protein P168DRAFT_244274, partial [Aspergillus campestris IBT 28561]
CQVRDNGHCIITRTSTPVDVAHIYSFALGKNQNAQTIFWSNLRNFWNPQRVRKWEEVLNSAQGTEICANMLSLSASVHRLWGMASFALKPPGYSTDQKTLRVRFFWLPKFVCSPQVSLEERPLFSNDLKGGQGNTKLFDCDSEKKIVSGDVITITTPDPKKYPLPSIELLGMQWALNRVLAISGAADVLDTALEDDDDDDDDDDGGGEPVMATCYSSEQEEYLKRRTLPRCLGAPGLQ